MPELIWPIEAQASYLATKLGPRVQAAQGEPDYGLIKTSWNGQKLFQGHVAIPFDSRLRAGQRVVLPMPWTTPGAVLNKTNLRSMPEQSVSMEELLDDVADKILIFLPAGATIVSGLVLPQGVHERAHGKYKDLEIRAITDYYIGTDQLVTRFDFLWVLHHTRQSQVKRNAA